MLEESKTILVELLILERILIPKGLYGCITSLNLNVIMPTGEEILHNRVV